MYIVLNNFNLTKNFTIGEFTCHNGSDKVIIMPELVSKLQALRDKIGKPIQIVSAFRTPEYNTKIGGAPKSQHLLGKAADIKVSGVSLKDLALLAEKIGFTGIGVYNHDGNNFVHLDIRPTRTYWKDASGHKLISIKSLKEV